MFNYQVEQKTYNIGKYSIEGDPRSTSTAMEWYIFYFKQKNIFIDEPKGIINKEFAEELIKNQEELADKTGLVPCLDVVLSYESSIKPIMDFIVDITDVPIFLDPPSYELKVPAIKYLKE
jgi:tetrahydromethanopterin S-methyltransferase subunit H